MEIKSNLLVENPLVSILVMTYNQEKFVSQTIYSILAQKSEFSYEIIIAEDCSTDSTKDICIEIFNRNKERVVIVANDTNKGLVRNYHETINNYARGKYIACCAGDDWWCDELKLQKQVDFLENNPEYDLVHTKSKIYVESSSVFLNKTMGDKITSFEQLIISGRIAALTVCFTKKSYIEYINEINPLQVNFASEDLPMWLWFSFRKKIYFLEDVTSVYRVQKESLSNSENPFKNHKDQLIRKNMKLFFYDYFRISDKNILNLIDLKYYIDTLRTAALVGDQENIVQRNNLFKKNKLYTLYLISQLYSICGKNTLLNNSIFFMERALRRVGITQKHYL